jgi:asparagine synthase (glutamine-hydrolysing)
MNLFVAGWNQQPSARARAEACLRAMHATYPHLDASGLSEWEQGRGYAAWMHPVPVGPRRYAQRTEQTLTLYDGSLVDPTGAWAAHDAAVLTRHWADLVDRLEGRFVVLRFDASADVLEVVNDPFGIHQTFVHRQGASWWISNSSRLLAWLTGSTGLDLDGMAQCLGMFFPSGDRTLIEGISVLPAGQRWTWIGDAVPRRATYAPASDLAELQKRTFGSSEAASLAGELGALLNVLANSLGNVRCPITAGRDTRMLTGMVLANRIAAEFFTRGDPASVDAKIATLIAKRLGLSHRVTGESEHDLADAWSVVSRRVVRQNDGLVTLAHARNALSRPERLDSMSVLLYGVAGELGRAVRLDRRLLRERPSPARMIAHVQAIHDRDTGLLRPEAREAVRASVREACLALLEQGFEPLELPDAFDLTEYVRRWAGAQARQGTEYRDVILPFCSRAYVRAAFVTPLRERYLERIPLGLLAHAAPALVALPLDEPWAAQNLAQLAVGWASTAQTKLWRRVARRLHPGRPLPAGRARERTFVLECHRQAERERCLDRSHSRLWQLVDRDRFDVVMSARTDQRERRRHHAMLYQALTAFAFEEDLEQLPAIPSPPANESDYAIL